MSKIFGDNLRTYREMARMSQQELADAVGTTRNSVSNYEIGRSEPNFESLCRFATVLGVDITDLINEHPFQNFVRKVQVTDEESLLLDLFRNADPTYRNVALDILRAHRKVDG